MSIPDTPMKPQETVIYLLGELKGQVVSLQSSVDSSQTTQAGINATVQSELRDLRSDVNVLKSQQQPKAPWWSIAAGLASIGAVIVVVVQLFAP